MFRNVGCKVVRIRFIIEIRGWVWFCCGVWGCKTMLNKNANIFPMCNVVCIQYVGFYLYLHSFFRFPVCLWSTIFFIIAVQKYLM